MLCQRGAFPPDGFNHTSTHFFFPMACVSWGPNSSRTLFLRLYRLYFLLFILALFFFFSILLNIFRFPSFQPSGAKLRKSYYTPRHRQISLASRASHTQTHTPTMDSHTIAQYCPHSMDMRDLDTGLFIQSCKKKRSPRPLSPMYMYLRSLEYPFHLLNVVILRCLQTTRSKKQ